MKKVFALMALLVIALFVLSACSPKVDEGSFSVIDDEDVVEDADSGDVFEELDSLDVEEDLDEVIDEEETVEVVEEDEELEEEEDLVEVVDDEEEEEPQTVTKTESGVYKVTVNEGELVEVKLDAKDPDGDSLSFKYEKPLDSDGRWQTEMGDDGKYYTTVIVSDGQHDVEVDVLIEVLSVNEDPVLERLSDIEVDEGDTVRIRPKATDADGDDLKFTYSGWMKSDTKSTDYEDAGDYKVTVTVSDGMGGEDSQTITVTVNDVNRAPVIGGLE